MNSWKDVEELDLKSLAMSLKEIIKKPAVLVLAGEVGAGKTTFTKSFIGMDDVVSPTYSVINEIDEYVHADFYRLKDARELEHLEIPLYVDGKDYLLIEWGKEFIEDLKSELGSGFHYYVLEFHEGSRLNLRNIALFSI